MKLNVSPMNQDGDFMVILRSIERLDKLKLDTESILDHKRLAKQIVLRNIPIISQNADEIKSTLVKSLE